VQCVNDQSLHISTSGRVSSFHRHCNNDNDNNPKSNPKQTVSARPLARGDSELHQLLKSSPGAKALAASRAAAARLVAHKSLAFLHNLYLESQELRELFRGEVRRLDSRLVPLAVND
jgi:hypothetical protein